MRCRRSASDRWVLAMRARVPGPTPGELCTNRRDVRAVTDRAGICCAVGSLCFGRAAYVSHLSLTPLHHPQLPRLRYHLVGSASGGATLRSSDALAFAQPTPPQSHCRLRRPRLPFCRLRQTTLLDPT
eukprot:1992429-Prymnesium_polylepis.1